MYLYATKSKEMKNLKFKKVEFEKVAWVKSYMGWGGKWETEYILQGCEMADAIVWDSTFGYINSLVSEPRKHTRYEKVNDLYIVHDMHDETLNRFIREFTYSQMQEAISACEENIATPAEPEEKPVKNICVNLDTMCIEEEEDGYYYKYFATIEDAKEFISEGEDNEGDE